MYFKLSLAIFLFAQAANCLPIKGTGLVSPIGAYIKQQQEDQAALAPSYQQGYQAAAPSYQAPSAPTYQAQAQAPALRASPSYSSTKGSKLVQPVLRPQQPSQKIGPVVAAVVTTRNQEVINVPSTQDTVTPQVVIIEPNLTPVTIEFRSRSSPVSIQQVHIPGQKGQTKTTRSEEEPDRVIHEVVKPVIQEVREIIQPFRKITQQILPVQEEVLSVVSKGERKQVVEKVEVPKVELPQEPVQEEVQQEEQQSAESSPVAQLLGSGTIVQAGLIGGTRILPADDSAALLASVNNRPNGHKN